MMQHVGSFIEAQLYDLEMKTAVPLMVFGQNDHDQIKSDTWAHVSIGLGRRQRKFQVRMYSTLIII